MEPNSQKDKFFIPFKESIQQYSLPQKFTYPFDHEPHPLCLLAAQELQEYLKHQKDFEHNFGLEKGQQGTIIGKMFGVLVVQTEQAEIGYLAAFSGKLANGYNHAKFVPPVFDSLTEGSFLNNGMTELSRINKKIKMLELDQTPENIQRIDELQKLRKTNSTSLQEKLFEHYYFLNQSGEEKNLRDLFQNNLNGNPPSGAGDCAAPKLLQYAFQHRMKPLAIAEFWWGLSPKSDHWKHKHFYSACLEKCEPILKHMLKGIEMDDKPE